MDSETRTYTQTEVDELLKEREAEVAERLRYEWLRRWRNYRRYLAGIRFVHDVESRRAKRKADRERYRYAVDVIDVELTLLKKLQRTYAGETQESSS